ncbi:DEAD/DEAH box helicase [Candidatus Bathyarchaeota archaeon]|nr:DEAD/DEAH box helicase [Candidatus Bathyarchaeota archaeon]
MKVSDLPVPKEVAELLSNLGIEKLYPPQEDAIKAGVLDGRNLVLASPTASGKTLIAELCAMKCVLEKGGKVLYLTPLRALASEKFREFMKYRSIRKRDGSKVKVAVSTGDYDSSDQWLGRYDIIVTTNEKADSLLRHRAEWMNEVLVTVADEVHLINDAERGPTLEVVLARLMQLNPNMQVLALSATIKNVEEIAEWLKAEYVRTEWRPIPLREGVYFQNEVMFKDGETVKVRGYVNHPSINIALDAVRKGGQALIFVGTRRGAMNLAKKASTHIYETLSASMKRSLESVAERIFTSEEKTKLSEALYEMIKRGVAFHHAGLTSNQRTQIEEAFREGKIKVLVATPTLAFGVNLPARVVVIHEYRRYEPGYGYYPISILEYKQMAGRAGRPRFDKVGEALLVARTDEEMEFLFENYVISEPERIWSKLGVERILRSHVLSTIAADYANTEEGVYEFFGRTFYSYQYGPNVIRDLIRRILLYLYEEEMITVKRRFLTATRFGRRVSELYLDPVSAVIIRDALLSRPKRISEVSFLHMIAHTPDMYPKTRPHRGEMKDLERFLEEHREELMVEAPDEYGDYIDFEEFLGEVKTAYVLYSWIREVTEDEILSRFHVQPGDLFRLIESAKWLLYSSKELARLLGQTELLPKLNEVLQRVEKGVERELLPLVRIKGIGRVRARILYDAGFRSIEDLRRTPLERLMEVPNIGSKLAMKIKEEVGGLIGRDEWERVKKTKEWKQSSVLEY